ncbi:MAG: glycosyltransferase [Candidatus Parvarchaeota archaeon]|nr:glycosyltransferase [Candidatus Rehaiarchaeum fermentans]
MKVLHVIDSLYAGGAESLLKNFLIEAKKFPEFQIDACTLYSRSIFKDELIENGVKVFDLGLNFKYDFRGIFRLIKLIKQNNYDLVHVHLFPSDLFCAFVSLFIERKVKFIFSEHSIYNRRRSIRIYKPIDLFVYSRYEKIICVSDLVRDELIKYIPKLCSKTVVIKNAIPIIGELQENRHKVYDVLFVGRLEDVKGVDILIKAIDIIKKENSRDLVVGVVGEGPLKEEYKKLVKELNLEDNFRFLGVRRDIDGLMKISKVFVLPSRWEGLPMVILEAMANGIPIIATNVGGIPEVIEDGVDGFLVKPEDPSALSERILLALNNPSITEQLKRNAFEKVKKEYSIEKYTERILNLYKEIAREQ